MLELEKLYQIKKYYWLLYPSKEIAHSIASLSSAELARHAGSTSGSAVYYSDYWSKEFNSNITYIPQNSIFCLLEQDGKDLLKILSTNGEMGWMIFPENEKWTKSCFEEIQ